MNIGSFLGLLIFAILPVLALIFLLWLLFTPSGKVFLGKEQAQRKEIEAKRQAAEKLAKAKSQAAEEVTKAKIQQARNSLTTTAKLAVIDEQAIQKIAQDFNHLNETKPYWRSKGTLANQIYQDVLQVANSIFSKVSPDSEIYKSIFDLLLDSAISSQELYDLALRALEANPSNSKAKQLVLKIGRYHFGKLRGGQATIYDEQAIQNDIQVRSS